MSGTTAWREAQRILGPAAHGPDDVATVFGAVALPEVPPIPFTPATLEAARAAGEMLVLRADRLAPDTPLTILAMIERFPDAFDARVLRAVGYQLKEEWGITLEPRAGSDTCTAGWALVGGAVLPQSCNRSYDEQTAILQRHAADRGLPAHTVRRRTAVETVYDTVLHFGARQARLLERTWDWTSSPTLDGGLLNIGGFGPEGMQIFSYSSGVRHGTLGVCPTCVAEG